MSDFLSCNTLADIGACPNISMRAEVEAMRQSLADQYAEASYPNPNPNPNPNPSPNPNLNPSPSPSPNPNPKQELLAVLADIEPYEYTVLGLATILAMGLMWAAVKYDDHRAYVEFFPRWLVHSKSLTSTW